MRRETKYLAITLAVCVTLAILGGVGYWGYTGWLTSKGYCFAQKRYLTDQEKIRLSVERLFEVREGYFSPFWPMREDMTAYAGKNLRDKDGKPLWALHRHKDRQPVKDMKSGQWRKIELPALDEGPVEPIPYLSVDEFFAINPGCCDIRNYYDMDSEGAWSFDFWDRFEGYGSGGVVWASYRYRYRDRNGVEREGTDGFYEEIVGNCGEGLPSPTNRWF